MRNVRYDRPKGFVDPLLSRDDKEMAFRYIGSNHVDRVRELKSSGEHGLEKRSAIDGTRSKHTKKYSNKISDPKDGRISNCDDEFDSDGYCSDGDERRIELLCIRRPMKIKNYYTDADISESSSHGDVKIMDGEIVTVDVEVRCWLINDAAIVLSAIAHDDGALFMETEAEILLTDLAAMKGISSEGFLDAQNDFNALLGEVANEIATTVEIQIEDDVPRLVLNLSTPDQYQEKQKEAQSTDGWSTEVESSPPEEDDICVKQLSASIANTSCASDEEIDEMLLGVSFNARI